MHPDTALPYDYAPNTRAGSGISIFLHLAASGVMIALDYFGILAIPVLVGALPLIALFLRCYLYGFVTNAVHEALRNADRDSYLDDIQTAYHEAADREERKVSLTPGFFSEKFLAQAPE